MCASVPGDESTAREGSGEAQTGDFAHLFSSRSDEGARKPSGSAAGLKPKQASREVAAKLQQLADGAIEVGVRDAQRDVALAALGSHQGGLSEQFLYEG